VNKSLDDLVAVIEGLDSLSKQRIFEAIQDHVTIHSLESEFGIPAHIILDAISRAGDLTQRGVRGIIAETVFATTIAPDIPGWGIDTPPGNHAYDTRLIRNGVHVRIQVKMQRRERGEPLMRSRTRKGPKSHYIVEIQRTRGGQKGGERTRPYRFGEFDVIAVCMQPSTRNWHDFLYASVWTLSSERAVSTQPLNDNSIIDTMQFVPPYPAEGDSDWTCDLEYLLDKIT
jgi:hypothetical protein